MRAQAQRLKREARMQAQADKLAMLPREMAGMGLDEDTICRELDKLKVGGWGQPQQLCTGGCSFTMHFALQEGAQCPS